MRAATGVPSVGVLWSAVASVRSGRRTLAAGEPQPVEGLRAGDLVDQVQVDVQQVRSGHLVGLPDLLEHRLWHGQRSLFSWAGDSFLIETPDGVCPGRCVARI